MIEKELLLFPQLKLNISVNADYQLGNEDENPQIEEFVLKSENYIVSSSRKTSCELSVENCVLLTTPHYSAYSARICWLYFIVYCNIVWFFFGKVFV